MNFKIHNEKGFKYLDIGKGEVLIMLHGLFGALSNWEGVVKGFSSKFRVIIPIMPIYEMPIKQASVDGLVDYVSNFIKFKSLKRFTLIGNSLGGHVGLIYTLKNKKKVERLVLTGSSGLFENSMGRSFPKRNDYKFVKNRVEYTFYDPRTATKELVDELFNILKSIPKCMRIVGIAKSAQRHNMAKELPKIDIPTLLIWGLNDTITPPFVAHEFNRLLPNSELKFVDKCGHAPMMEHPDKFNLIFNSFLEKTKS